MSEPEARQRLAAQQAALLRALLTDADPPPGFDPTLLHVEANALLAKRRQITANLRPDVVAALGDRFVELFNAYARARPRQDGTRARADADAFADWLAERDEPRPISFGRRLWSRLPRRRNPGRR
jgi:hypothetical protein